VCNDSEKRTADQHNARSVAEWTRRTDASGNLSNFFVPDLSDVDRIAAEIEGWILGLK